jgi:ABC-type Fe3+ transport system substrate-binding protein
MSAAEATNRVPLFVLLALVVLILALPFLLRAPHTSNEPSALPRMAITDQLVIISPHLEAVRRKFDRAFARWYAQTYHRGVDIEYLSYTGGEIIRYFQASEAVYQRSGTYNVDIVWGGSDSMFNDVLKGKYLARLTLDPQVMRAAFPQPDIGGVPLYDPDPVAGPRWFGAALSSFGILFNRDVLRQLQLPEPKTWADLADPRYRGWVQLADPTRSASAKSALMVIVEREMETAAQQGRSQAEAWARGMGLIRQIAANARGFAAAASELPAAVSSGDAAAAMAIDFYARSQIAAVAGDRMGYVEPQGATMITPEPIAMVQGAQHAEVARRFIEFVLSDAGQRLWLTRPGPGETPEMALQRLPVMPSVYDNPVGFTEFVNPYHVAGGFNTKPARRRTFGVMDELMALCCIDLLPDLRETRAQILQSSRASELDERLGRFPVDQAAAQAGDEVHQRMLHGKPEDWLALQQQWRRQFREEYRELRRAAAGARAAGRPGARAAASGAAVAGARAAAAGARIGAS